MTKQADILKFFGELPDPRVERSKLHSVEDIVFISVAAIICGAESWNDIEDFGESKKDWLKTFLELPNGIPSHDTFNRFFSCLDPGSFEKCFLEWTRSIAQRTEGDIISIDGKTIRGSRVKGPKSAIHMVSAWTNNNQLTLGQIKVNDKSNEITAIPELLDVLLLKGSIVTIDAMGCQTAIASKIIDKHADYLLAVKDNQHTLREGVQDTFRFNKPSSVWQDIDCGHGRVETRTCSVISNLNMIENYKDWMELKTIVKIESERFIKATAITETDTRYYITSLEADAEKIGKAARAHWGIENSLHWVLDVAFGEDKSRKRVGNAAQNASILYRVALNLLKNEQSSKRGIKGKRLKAGWDNTYLLKMIKI